VSDEPGGAPPPHKRAHTSLAWDDEKDILVLEDDSHDVTQSLTHRDVHASDVARNVFSTKGVAGLASFLPLSPRNLTLLDVSNTPIEIDGALSVVTCVAQMPWVQLRVLRMDNVGMYGSADARKLSSVLKENAHMLAITELSLKNNVFGEEGVLIVAEALCSLSTLVCVALSGCAPNASDDVCQAATRRVRAALAPGRMSMDNDLRGYLSRGVISVSEHCATSEGDTKQDTAFSRAKRTRPNRLELAPQADAHPQSANGETEEHGPPILRMENEDHRIQVFKGATIKQLIYVLCKVRRYTNEMCSRWEYIPADLARLELRKPGCEPVDLLGLAGAYTDLPLADVLSHIGGVGSVITLKSPYRTEFDRRITIMRLSHKFKLPADVTRRLIALTVPYVARDSYGVVPWRYRCHHCVSHHDKAWFYTD
jgi:hypothetical protein